LGNFSFDLINFVNLLTTFLFQVFNVFNFFSEKRVSKRFYSLSQRLYIHGRSTLST